MSQSNQLQEMLRQGIAAARQGDTATARKLLEAVVAQDDSNELAWIWLASTVSSQRERRICLEKVLQINPDNTRAREALNSMVGIGQKTGVSSADLARDVAESSAVPQNRRLPFDPNSWTARIGVIALVILVLLVIPSILTPPLPQVTPMPVPSITPTRATSTPAPPPTFPGVRVTRDPDLVLLPPTFTPTVEPTDLPTSTPTPTPIPMGAFTMIVSERAEGQSTSGLYQYVGDGSGEQFLGDDVRQMSYDLGGENIVFVRDVSYPADGDLPAAVVSEVFTAPVNDIASARQITTLRTHSARNPVFNPRGREILFVSDYDGDDELWLIDPVTEITTQITHNTTIDRDPAWSPDGSKIVFASDREAPGYLELFVLEFTAEPAAVEPDITTHDSGYSVRRLSSSNGSSYHPVWSHDGTMIAFVNDADGDGDVLVMNATGSRVQVVTIDSGIENRFPSWTPDGHSVVFISNREDERFQVYVVRLNDRSNITRLLTGERQADSVAFKPDITFRLP